MEGPQKVLKNITISLQGRKLTAEEEYKELRAKLRVLPASSRPMYNNDGASQINQTLL